MPVPSPFLVMATQNPIESEGTYALPEAQLDRFMLKVLVDYPDAEDELVVIDRALAGAVELEQALSLDELAALQASVRSVYVDPALVRYAQRLAGATRNLGEAGLAELAAYVEYGVSPRGPINLALAARALALLRGRRYVVADDLRRAGQGRVPAPDRPELRSARRRRLARRRARPRARGRPDARSRLRAPGGGIVTVIQLSRRERTPDRPGPGPLRDGQLRKLDLTVRRRVDSLLLGDYRATADRATGPSWLRCGRTSSATTCGRSTGT